METARHRLDVYYQQTMPLVQHYQARGIVHEIDGRGDVHEVTARVLQELGLVNSQGTTH